MPVEIYALQLCAERVSLTTNDLASSEYAKVLSLAVPCIVARVIRKSGGQNDSEGGWDRIAYLRTALYLDRHASPAHWKQDRMKQQRFVRTQDQQSRRCGPLYGQPVPAGERSSVNEISSLSSFLCVTEPYYNGVLYCPSPFDSALNPDGKFLAD
jgi:hypothetical protein